MQKTIIRIWFIHTHDRKKGPIYNDLDFLKNYKSHLYKRKEIFFNEKDQNKNLDWYS